MTEPREIELVAPLAAPFLALGREAHRLGQHAVAYHALMAAMHAADDAGDVPALAAVRHEAAAQIAWIDDHEPTHRLSTTSAARHQHPGVYAMLVRQTAAYVQMHRSIDPSRTRG